MSLCRFKNALGEPRRGLHRARVPGTSTAAFDYFGTIALAWATSWLFGIGLSASTIAWFAAAEVSHRLFCVETG